MIPKKIGETGWTVQDWDQQFPAVFAADRKELTIEINGTDIYVEFDEGSPYRYNMVGCTIPLEVLAEVLKRNGYDVEKKPVGL